MKNCLTNIYKSLINKGLIYHKKSGSFTDNFININWLSQSFLFYLRVLVRRTTTLVRQLELITNKTN
jgi:hypothetical protein